MCGRTACTLDPDDICHACAHLDKRGQWIVPEWREAPDGRRYYPSYNVAPTSYTPVMISKNHIDPEADTALKVIQPMYWGLVPFWHRGDIKDVGLSTNNARSETLMSKRTFSVPLKKGRRCVVLADGYYEWQKAGSGSKQPYFIYFPQPNGLKIEDNSWKNLKKIWTKKSGWAGPRLLTMAGVFDIWTDPSDSNEVYSYSVVTLDSSSAVSWIHERMPAILDGDEAIDNWLNFGEVTTEEALELLVSVKNLQCHPVSTIVGNSRNNSPECMQPIDLKKPNKKSKSSALMMNWLQKGPSVSPKKEVQASHDKKPAIKRSPKREVSPGAVPKKVKKEKM